MTMQTAQKVAKNILDIFEGGKEPPITHLHSIGLTTKSLPPGIPKQYLAKIPSIDVQKLNHTIMNQALTKNSVRVESISTCMGCVMTTCVVDVDQLPR